MFLNPNKLLQSLKNNTLSNKSIIQYFILFFSFNFLMLIIDYLISLDKSFTYSKYIGSFTNTYSISIIYETLIIFIVVSINGAKDIFIRYVSLKITLIFFLLPLLLITAGIIIGFILAIGSLLDINTKILDYIFLVLSKPVLVFNTILNSLILYFFWKLNK